MVDNKKILIKLSGETLRGENGEGVSSDACRRLALTIKSLKALGHEVSIVIGGGNIIRGVNAEALGLPRVTADQMGMLATFINGIALQGMLETIGIKSRVLSAIECPRIVEAFNWKEAIRLLSEGAVVIFVGGTGNPYFSTDTAAVLRASEVKVDLILKATKVDGIYDKDPLKYSDAKRYSSITYTEVLAQKLKVMDATSIALARDNEIQILVFRMDLLTDGSEVTVEKLKRAGTLVH